MPNLSLKRGWIARVLRPRRKRGGRRPCMVGTSNSHYPRMPPDRQKLNNFALFYRVMLRPIIAAASLVLIAGTSLGCSKGLFAGDTTFSDKEMTPAQRKAAIKDLQTQTNWQPQ